VLISSGNAFQKKFGWFEKVKKLEKVGKAGKVEKN
jgi:hypothetical protein